MEVRPAEMIAFGPFGIDGIEAGLGRIADNDGVLRPRRVDRAPRNLVRQFVDNGGGIEFGGGADAQHAGERQGHHEVSPEPGHGFHGFLRCFAS
jgi:hypothetical protein